MCTTKLFTKNSFLPSGRTFRCANTTSNQLDHLEPRILSCDDKHHLEVHDRRSTLLDHQRTQRNHHRCRSLLCYLHNTCPFRGDTFGADQEIFHSRSFEMNLWCEDFLLNLWSNRNHTFLVWRVVAKSGVNLDFCKISNMKSEINCLLSFCFLNFQR